MVILWRKKHENCKTDMTNYHFRLLTGIVSFTFKTNILSHGCKHQYFADTFIILKQTIVCFDSLRLYIIPKRSIDRGVVLLSKNKSFLTAFARLCGILPALLP